MPREDSLSSRFDYLFEPLDDDESTDGVIDAESASGEAADRTPTSRSGAPVRMAFAGFVLATLGVAAVIAALLLHRPNEPTDPVEVPLEPAPLSTTVADIPTQAATVPPSPPTEGPTEAPQTIGHARGQQPPQTQQSQTPSPRERQGGVTNSPNTRAPISVAPETRPPFPSQEPRTGGDGPGGLLGGGGLL